MPNIISEVQIVEFELPNGNKAKAHLIFGEFRLQRENVFKRVPNTTRKEMKYNDRDSTKTTIQTLAVIALVFAAGVVVGSM